MFGFSSSGRKHSSSLLNSTADLFKLRNDDEAAELMTIPPPQSGAESLRVHPHGGPAGPGELLRTHSAHIS